MSIEIANWTGQLLAGRYRVTAKLGEGGMGLVFRATDQHLDGDVVIKVPHRAILADPTFAGRFAREVRSLVKLAHAHVVKILDVSEHDGLPFVVLCRRWVGASTGGHSAG
jgi:serine/threonine-protein kinase